MRARGFDRPVRPWITLFVEAYSRVIPGWSLSVQPSSASILAALGSAVAVTPAQPWGGIPVRLRVDRGADFLSNALRGACGRLGVVLDPAPPDSPFRKGKVEVAGKLVERALLPPLAGYRGAGPETREQRSSLLGLEVWSACCGRASTPGIAPTSIPSTAARWPGLRARRHTDPHGGRGAAAVDDLVEDGRIVQKEGVRLGGRYFTAAELTGRRGEPVQVLHWPHDQRRVEVVLRGEWLCTAKAYERTLDALVRKRLAA